jgi:PAS domain S-box-containing protein
MFKRYLFAFDNAPVGIVWHDKEGKIIQVNRYAAEKLEYAPDELIGNYLYKFVVLSPREKDKDYYSEETAINHRHDLFTKHGKIIPITVSIVGVPKETGDFGCAFFSDISDKFKLFETIDLLRRDAGDPKSGTPFKLDFSEERIKDPFKDFIGKSKTIGKIFKLICHVAPTPATVLVIGETGTGKELVAAKIHALSGRRSGQFIKVNCAAIPDHLIEGELFGYEKGAFTGATTSKPGRFELADKGTLFLDEIGDMSFELQAKLLRVLQDGTFDRLGGTRPLKVDVRVVAALNRNPMELVKKGLFRQDLYFRLNTFPINIPPLKKRKDDIPLLARYFIENFCKHLNRKPKTISPASLKALQGYDWPGNIRELKNVLERACILSTDDSLELDADSFETKETAGAVEESLCTFEENERRYILRVLEQTEGQVFGKKGAAAIMGINPRTLVSKMKKLKISKSSPGMK